jgi:hypothetical protein
MSTYGATNTLLGPGAGGAGGGGGGFGADVVGAGVVGFGPGGFVPVALGAGPGFPPPVHGAPLIVHDVGAPLPATMNPKLVEELVAITAL